MLPFSYYWPLQLHLAGKTDQAKADLGRLAAIRAEREAAQARRKAEAEGTIIDCFRAASIDKMSPLQPKQQRSKPRRKLKWVSGNR